MSRSVPASTSQFTCDQQIEVAVPDEKDAAVLVGKFLETASGNNRALSSS